LKVDLSGWDAAAILAKAITYAATLGAAGGVFLLAYADNLLLDQPRIRIQRLIGVLLITGALASVARISLLGGSMSSSLAGMFDLDFAGMILRAGEGRATGIRILGLIVAAFALSPNRQIKFLGVVGAIIAATSFAWVGHIHALRPNAIPAAFLSLHLLCAAFWLGALAPLLMVSQENQQDRTSLIVTRFATLALSVVAMLLAAGLGLLWILITDAAQFWRSDYGRLIALKLLAVACLLGIAARNKLKLTPQLLNGDRTAASRLRRSIVAEMMLAAAILLLTAAFTTITGPAH
jgi:copper resistance protein D